MRQSGTATDIYVELESKYFGDWNNIGNLIETLAAIDIYPQETKVDMNQSKCTTSTGNRVLLLCAQNISITF